MSEIDEGTTENNVPEDKLTEDPPSLVQDHAEAPEASGDNDNFNDAPVEMDTMPITEDDTRQEQEEATQDLREESDSKSADDNAVARTEFKSISNSDILQANEDSRSSIQSVKSSRSIDPILKQGSLMGLLWLILYIGMRPSFLILSIALSTTRLDTVIVVSNKLRRSARQTSFLLRINNNRVMQPKMSRDIATNSTLGERHKLLYVGNDMILNTYSAMIEIDRHKLGPQELNHLMLKMLVSEVQVTLGLTAVKSRDVWDLMMREYPEKFNEYLAAQDEKKKENIRGRHQQYTAPTVEKSQLPNYMKKAMKQVSDFNARLNRRRKEEYAVYYDMQTNVLQLPKIRRKKLHPDLTRPSLYPCSLIPGQFQEYCQKYTSDELGYFPLNTAIHGPPVPTPDEISELMQYSGSESESEEEEVMETDAIGSKSERSPVTEQDPDESVVKESHEEVTRSSSPSKIEESEINEESSNSTDTISNKDQSVAGSEQASNSAPTKEELMQNYIEDPDKPMCGICLHDETSNKKGEPEDLISCSQCDNYGHPSCLDMSKELVSVIVTYNWQCLECKTCTYCNKPHHEDKMMFCDRCDRGYHTFCVGLRNLPSGLWMCPQCTRSDPDFAKKGAGRRPGPRKRQLPRAPTLNLDGTPKPKRKRRTKKEMEEAREKERLLREEREREIEKSLRKLERKAEKKERKRLRRLKKEQELAAAIVRGEITRNDDDNPSANQDDSNADSTPDVKGNEKDVVAKELDVPKVESKSTNEDSDHEDEQDSLDNKCDDHKECVTSKETDANLSESAS